MPVETITKENDQVKYHLVEAEEVETKPLRMKNAKGKLQWTQLPLDLPSKQHEENYPRHQTKGNNRKGNGRRWKNGKKFYQVPDVKVTAEWAKTQIEYYFTPDNLVRDTFLRRNMDVDGYVPVMLVAGFQAVYAYHQDYQSLLEALKTSEILELDLQNEKIRAREGWQKWLWPNANGGYGLPRYVKVVEQPSDEVETDKESNN